MHRRESELIQVDGLKRGRGRPKFILVEIVKKDISNKEVRESTQWFYIGTVAEMNTWSVLISWGGSILDPNLIRIKI